MQYRNKNGVKIKRGISKFIMALWVEESHISQE
jgi:hypothetical protein